MKDYIINQKTLAIIKENTLTRIIEVDNSLVINKNILKIIDSSCRYYGSSYKGRIEGSKNILKNKYKLPILINDNLLFFPLNDNINNNLLFLNYKMLQNYQKNGNKLILIFANNIMLTINCSDNKLKNSLVTCTLFNNIINIRKVSK